MTEPRPPIEALDEQEREIARILRALPGGEPPPALDARILRSAANAAAGTSRPRSRWLAPLGSFWGVGGAAAAVLALGVSWQLIDPSHRQSGVVGAPVAVERDSDAAMVVDLGQPRLESQAPAADALAPPPPSSTVAEPPRQRAARPAPQTVAPAIVQPPAAVAAAPQAFPEERGEPMPAAAPAEPSLDYAAEADAMAESGSEQMAAAQAKAQSSRETAARSAEEALGANSGLAADALSREAAPLTPTAWLARVRRLHAADRIEEARASLREFRKQYPGHAIPSDLAPLLRE